MRTNLKISGGLEIPVGLAPPLGTGTMSYRMSPRFLKAQAGSADLAFRLKRSRAYLW